MIHRFLLVIALFFSGFSIAVEAQDTDSARSIELSEDQPEQEVISLDKSEGSVKQSSVDKSDSKNADAEDNKNLRSIKARKSLEKSKRKIESRVRSLESSSVKDETKTSEKEVQRPLNLLKPQVNLKQEVEADKKEETGVPIEIAGEELFRIKAKLGPYTPEIRAHSITQRLAQLEKSDNLKQLVEGIKVEESDYSTDIVAGDLTLMTVTTLDAKFEGVESRDVLAEKYAAALKRAMLRDIESKNPETILKATGLTILATIIFGLSVAAMNWIFPRIYGLLIRWKGTLIQPIRIQQAELLSAATITDVLIGSFRFLRVVVFLIAFGTYIYADFSFFPQTRPLVRDGVQQIAKPITEVLLPAVFGYLPNLVFIALIIVTAYYFNVFTHFIFREIERETIVLPGFDAEWSDPTYKIIRFMIIAFALILLFPYLPGSGSPAFQQVSIFLGLLFSLASTGPLSHVIAGTFLTYTGALRLGDRVKIADTVGDVVEKTLLATKIQTIKNEIITIPNGLVLGNHIINYSSSTKGNGLILNTTITLGYDVPWDKIEEVLIQAAHDTEYIIDETPPYVWQTALGDFSVSYQLNAYTKHPNKMGAIYSELHKHIQNRCNEAGIEILSPTYSAVRDGNRTTIPENYLPSDYQVPMFSVPFMPSTKVTKKETG